MSFFTGSPGRFEQISTLRPDQQPLSSQLINAAQRKGAGGSFGQAGDYYRSLLEDDNSTFNAFAQPEQRRFREQIIPDIAEQFAGMGSGSLSSSGFRNAAVNAGTDLSERLGALRAQLRQQGASGLMSLGQQGLQPFQENIYRAPTPGFFESISPLLGSALGSFTLPISSAVGNKAGTWLSQSLKGKSSPYGAMTANDTNLRSPTSMFRG